MSFHAPKFSQYSILVLVAPETPVPEAVIDEQRYRLFPDHEVRPDLGLELRAITGDAHRGLC